MSGDDGDMHEYSGGKGELDNAADLANKAGTK
jgi:hypothetical protein